MARLQQASHHLAVIRPERVEAPPKRPLAHIQARGQIALENLWGNALMHQDRNQFVLVIFRGKRFNQFFLQGLAKKRVVARQWIIEPSSVEQHAIVDAISDTAHRKNCSSA